MPDSSSQKEPWSGVRLSKEGRELLEKLAKFYGISMTATAEVALRELAQRLGMVDTKK